MDRHHNACESAPELEVLLTMLRSAAVVSAMLVAVLSPAMAADWQGDGTRILGAPWYLPYASETEGSFSHTYSANLYDVRNSAAVHPSEYDMSEKHFSTSADPRQIVALAAQAPKINNVIRIEANGYTDLSGSASNNDKLSIRRAKSVAAELVRDGVGASEISIHGYGESSPLVPTKPGVREPQNRRVEIIFR